MAHFESMGLNGAFYQSGTDDEPIAEPALLIRNVNGGDILQLHQEERYILINTASLEQFIKALRMVAKAKQK